MSAPNSPTRKGLGVARAHPNIALVKYWGKRNDELILPAVGSLSLTLDVFPTQTRVCVDSELAADEVCLGAHPAPPEFRDRVRRFLDHVRRLAGTQAHARVDTHNTVPTGAGLASSASGFAALALAASQAYGLELDEAGLSRLARRGSGSASRSVIGGLAVWEAGWAPMGADGQEDLEYANLQSVAHAIPGPDLGMVVVVLDAGEKVMSSRQAMRLCADSSPLYPDWVDSGERDLQAMITALANDDFTTVGEITESNAMRMHATIAACQPSVRYLSPASHALFELAATLRAAGLETYATADAGPNVVLVSRVEDVKAVGAAVAKHDPQLTRVVAGPGAGAHLIADVDVDSARSQHVPSADSPAP